MQVLDDDGRLFGILNVVDALVILLVVAVVIAGLALVTGGEAKSATTHVTLDLGTQPLALAERIEDGDTYAPTEGGQLTITDVYLAPQGDGARAIVRARLNGTTVEDPPESAAAPISYAGAPPQLDRRLAVETSVYDVTGRILAVGNSPDLELGTQEVVVKDVLDVGDAAAIAPGDTYAVADQPVATVENVQVYNTGDPERVRVLAGLSLRTIDIGPETRFGDTVLRKGVTVPVRTDAYNLAGQIDHIGTAMLDRQTRQVLVSDTIDATDADAVTPGDTYEVAGHTIGTIESVQVYSTGNPDRDRVVVGLILQTIAAGDRSRFGETVLRKGVTVPFDTDAYTLDGRVERLGTTAARGTATTRQVTLEMHNVPPRRATIIEAGMTDRAGGHTLAELVAVHREPSPVVLTSDGGDIFLREHPLNQDLTLTAELSVRETTEGVRFKGETIQQGSDITLAFGDTTVRATVVGL